MHLQTALVADRGLRLPLAGDVVDHHERRGDDAIGVGQRHAARPVGTAAGLVLAREGMSLERLAAVRLDPRDQHRIEDVGERPPDDLWRAARGEMDGVAFDDQAAQPEIDDEGEAAGKVRRRRRPRPPGVEPDAERQAGVERIGHRHLGGEACRSSGHGDASV